MKRTVMMLAAAALIAFPSESQNAGVSALRLSLESTSVSGGERVKGRLVVSRTTGVPAQPVTVKLESSDPTLVRFSTPEIIIPATESGAPFDFSTAATPIKTSVTIRALVAPASTVQAQSALELLPALIHRVTLNRTSMIGTIGATIDATVELKAAAPAGGIELYLGVPRLTPPIAVKADPLAVPNPRVAAGSRTGTFPIPYNALVQAFSSFQYSDRDFSSEFESQPRRVDILVTLDPLAKDSIPNKAVKVGFDLIPLRITSISVQPATATAGGEALATFVLSAPPAANERVRLDSNSSRIRVVLLGSTCQSTSTVTLPPDLTLTAGSTTQSFKVCARPVSSVTTGEVSVLMRSGLYKTGFTVNP